MKLSFPFLSFFTLKTAISRTSFREVWLYFQIGEVKRLMQNPMGGKAWMLRDFLRTLRVRLHRLGGDSWSWVASSCFFLRYRSRGTGRLKPRHKFFWQILRHSDSFSPFWSQRIALEHSNLLQLSFRRKTKMSSKCILWLVLQIDVRKFTDRNRIECLDKREHMFAMMRAFVWNLIQRAFSHCYIRRDLSFCL